MPHGWQWPSWWCSRSPATCCRDRWSASSARTRVSSQVLGSDRDDTLVFSKDEGVIAVGTEYLRIISFNYVASGLVFVASSTFQAMGNTVPSLIASVVRIALVAIPGVIISRLPGFELHWLDRKSVV